MDDRLTQVEKKVKDRESTARTQRKDTQNKILEVDKKIESIQEELKTLQNDVKKTKRPTEIQQAFRSAKINNVVISGIKEKDDGTEDLTQEIQNLATRLGASISPNFQAKRLGDDSSRKPRPILVEFGNLWDRRKLFAAHTKIAEDTQLKGQIYINEDLERNQAKLFFLTRKARQMKLIKNCWTYGGSVHMTLIGSNEPIEIDSEDTLRHHVPQLPKFTKQNQAPDQAPRQAPR